MGLVHKHVCKKEGCTRRIPRRRKPGSDAQFLFVILGFTLDYSKRTLEVTPYSGTDFAIKAEKLFDVKSKTWENATRLLRSQPVPGT